VNKKKTGEDGKLEEGRTTGTKKQLEDENIHVTGVLTAGFLCDDALWQNSLRQSRMGGKVHDDTY